MNRRASCVGTFEVFEAAHVALRTLLAFLQPVNCIFWPIGMLNWLVAASKLHKHRETCCTAEWPFYSFLILCLKPVNMSQLVGRKTRLSGMHNSCVHITVFSGRKLPTHGDFEIFVVTIAQTVIFSCYRTMQSRNELHIQKYRRLVASCQFYRLVLTCQQVATNLSTSSS